MCKNLISHESKTNIPDTQTLDMKAKRGRYKLLIINSSSHLMKEDITYLDKVEIKGGHFISEWNSCKKCKICITHDIYCVYIYKYIQYKRILFKTQLFPV